MKCAVVLIAASLLAPCGVCAAETGAEAEAQRFSQMYFASMDGANFFRLYAPGTGLVEFCRNWRKGGIDGAGGWRVSVETNGDYTVREPGSRASYTFRKGRPFSMVASDGRRLRMKFDEEPVIPGKIPPMWEGAEEEAREAVVEKFTGNRLKLFYINPNHAAMLLAELALLGLFAFLFGRKPVVIATGAVWFVVSCWLLAKTEGRGGALGLAVGAALLTGFRLFRRGGKIRAAIVSVMAIAVVVAFCIGSGLGGRFSLGKMTDGTSARIEKWRVVPRMMVDSPCGWGETPPGRAYSDWYQPLSSSAVTPTLDSDHLTYMTGRGWVGRFVWGCVWLFVLLSLFRFSAGGGSPLPLAMLSAVALAAMFNPLIHMWSLWIVPIASLWPFVVSRPWKEPRRYVVPLAVAAAVSLSLCFAFYLAGRAPSRGAALSIFSDGCRVYVGSRKPDVWVADDRYSIGWLFAPKEIRYYYSAYPRANPLGYVQKLTDVPQRVRRLAVAGRLCREYVKLWNAGAAPAADELIFLSPGMPPNAVPESLRKSCRFAMVVGEFAARYVDVYGRNLESSDEVVLTEGAEVYQPGWVSLILAK